jgi:hypothetical protein
LGLGLRDDSGEGETPVGFWLVGSGLVSAQVVRQRQLRNASTSSSLPIGRLMIRLDLPSLTAKLTA